MQRSAHSKEASQGWHSVAKGIAIITLIAIGVLIYSLRDPIKSRLFPPAPSFATIGVAIEQAYERISPLRVKSSWHHDSGNLRVDRVRLPRDASLLRANYEITRAVEEVGGYVAYGIESIDERQRWQTVTLGISNGDTLVCEIRLEKRLR